jgi:hypothetical protein
MAARSRGSVTDRPSRWKLLLRRQRWLARPVAWGLVVLVFLGGNPAAPSRHYESGSVY